MLGNDGEDGEQQDPLELMVEEIQRSETFGAFIRLYANTVLALRKVVNEQPDTVRKMAAIKAAMGEISREIKRLQDEVSAAPFSPRPIAPPVSAVPRDPRLNVVPIRRAT